jgi:hypothetical protein
MLRPYNILHSQFIRDLPIHLPHREIPQLTQLHPPQILPFRDGNRLASKRMHRHSKVTIRMIDDDELRLFLNVEFGRCSSELFPTPRRDPHPPAHSGTPTFHPTTHLDGRWLNSTRPRCTMTAAA